MMPYEINWVNDLQWFLSVIYVFALVYLTSYGLPEWTDE